MNQSSFRGLLVAALIPFLGSSCSKTEPSVLASNVLLISIDTLRADHLGSYGYNRPTSPALDRLAARGVLFADASAACQSKSWNM